MNILAMLASGAKSFHGEGVNEENERFLGELKVQSLEGGRAVLLSYKATLETGVTVHTESTLLGTGPNGKLCLWPVMSEIPVVLPHTELMNGLNSGSRTAATFGSGPRDQSDSFREEITIEVNPDGSLVYSHAWGQPGGAFEDRSSCRMVPRDA
jgi:hypothetical protein